MLLSKCKALSSNTSTTKSIKTSGVGLVGWSVPQKEKKKKKKPSGIEIKEDRV
jgi:hypothetical protein